MAVLADPHGLEVSDSASFLDARQKLRQLVLALGWNQLGGRFTHDFGGGITVHPLRCTIPAHDDALERITDDRVIRRLNNRAELADR